MSKGLSPVYGDCYARWYNSQTRVHFNADMEEIPDEIGAAGKPEEEGRRLHDLWKRNHTIEESERQQIEQEERSRRQAQANNEAQAQIKRQCDLVSKALRQAGVSEAEINRQCEQIRVNAGMESDDTAEADSGADQDQEEQQQEQKPPTPPDRDPNRKRPSDALGALIWDVDNSNSPNEKEQVLRAAHHQTLSNLVIKLDKDPAIGDGSKEKNVAIVLAALDSE